MAKFIVTGKGKKRFITALSILLSASLSLGIVSACNPTEQNDDEDDNPVSATDTQLLKNGNFEFYSEMDEKDRNERRAFIASPNDWSFSSGSPSSDTSSGVIDTADWAYMTANSEHKLIPAQPELDEDGKEKEHTLTDAIAASARANWDSANVYDRLEFYDYYDIDSASEFDLYGDYRYSNDFEDLEYLHEVANTADKPLLYTKENRGEDDTSILMIHNRRTSDGVRGTAQYYTSGTTITVNAGTAAKVSVWVRTSELYHYAAGTDGAEDIPVEKRAGAYIGVTNTVGGTALDQMQIRNINTHDEWQQYTVYIRANSFATTTFRIVLGLGQGSSDNRYEAVDGYAFFDDVTCDIITDKAYNDATASLSGSSCDLNSKGDEKKFSATDDQTGAPTGKAYALDLNKTEDFEQLNFTAAGAETTFGLTQEVSGSQTYTSETIDKDLKDTSKNDGNKSHLNIAELMTLDGIEATGNGYLKTIYKNDFENKFPFTNENNIVMLLSTNGAAYTATVTHPDFTLAPKARKLISFFVKTSELPSGKTGASAILMDGTNPNAIAAFDSNTVATVDIDADSDDPAMKDIYKGWVRCFFFVENDTEENKTFTLKLTYGPTSIADTSKTDYTDGYAAFANFEICDLTKAQYGYAATGTYAQKVSLTASEKDSSKFADASANGPSLEEGLAIPVGYTGVQAGSNILVSVKDENGNVTNENKNPGREQLAVEDGIYTGLLSKENAEKYLDLDVNLEKTYSKDIGKEVQRKYYPNKWMTALNAGGYTDADEWWKNTFGNAFEATAGTIDPAYQPLVILNTTATEQKAYGFFAANANVAANASSRISVRVKLSKDATATIYLTDVSAEKKDSSLAPTLPKVTYWYDDEGNIVKGDPSADEFDEEKDILFTRESNGLYKKVGDTADTYYANLAAFGDPDEKGNLVTTDGTIAFYGHDGKFYAYYDKESDTYTQPVEDLPDDAGVRYTAPAAGTHEAKITVKGTDENAGKWVTISFYVNAGNTQKNYRLELWAGTRDGKTGIPGNAYVFFDRCKTATANDYATSRDAAVAALKDHLGVADDDNLPATYEETGAPLALYYTFTFYDSPDYLRYDETADEEQLGDPWGSYVQSSHSEQLMWLYYEDPNGTLPNGTGMPSVSLYMSYGENEVTVTPDELGDSGNDSNDSDTSTDTTPGGNTSIWLLLSSILLAVALIFAICALVFRRLWKKYHHASGAKKATAPKPAKAPAKQPQPEEPAPAPAPAKPSEKKETAPDENDPYNE